MLNDRILTNKMPNNRMPNNRMPNVIKATECRMKHTKCYKSNQIPNDRSPKNKTTNMSEHRMPIFTISNSPNIKFYITYLPWPNLTRGNNSVLSSPKACVAFIHIILVSSNYDPCMFPILCWILFLHFLVKSAKCSVIFTFSTKTYDAHRKNIQNRFFASVM
jgi:hypothetical protein